MRDAAAEALNGTYYNVDVNVEELPPFTPPNSTPCFFGAYISEDFDPPTIETGPLIGIYDLYTDSPIADTDSGNHFASGVTEEAAKEKLLEYLKSIGTDMDAFDVDQTIHDL
jgi:hypothetical protein